MRIIKTAIFMAVIALSLASVPACADICVLDKSQYMSHFNSTPFPGNNACRKADLADGTEDQKIKVDIYVGTDIELYVVFTQDTPTAQKVSAFDAKFTSDPKMFPYNCDCVGANTCTLSDATTCGDTCCDQSPVFTNNNTDFGSGFGEYKSDYIEKKGSDYLIWFARGGLDLTSTTNNFLLMTIRIPARNNTYMVGDTVTSAIFSPYDTDVLDTNYESLVANGVSKMYQTDFTVPQHGCRTNPPVAGSVTCRNEIPGVCDNTTGPFKATLTFTPTSGCERDVFNCTGLSTEIDGTTIAASPYVKTGITTTSPPRFTLVGKSSECMNSTPIESAQPICECPPPPMLTQMTVTDVMMYFAEVEIQITYSIEFDPEVYLTQSAATFYYTTPGAVALTPVSVPLDAASCPANSCTVKTTIPALAMEEGVDVKFGMKAVDSNGNTTYFPWQFRETSLYNASVIRGSQILDAHFPSLSIYQGWNLVGVSGQGVSFSPAEVFGSNAFQILGFSGNEFLPLADADPLPLEAAHAYWIYSSVDVGRIIITGNGLDGSSYSIDLQTGWNLFSNPFNQYVNWSDDKAAITCNGAGDALKNAYYYNGSGYSAAVPNIGMRLRPWRGYWIKSAGNCTLTITK